MRPSSSIPCKSTKNNESAADCTLNMKPAKFEQIRSSTYGACTALRLQREVPPEVSLSLSTENCLIIHPFIPEINTSLLSRNAFPEIQLLHVFSLALCMDITTSQKRTGDLLNYMILRCSCRSCIWCGDCEKTEAKSHVKKCALIPIELDWRANRLSPMNRLSSEITGWSSRLQENNWPLI